MWIVNILVFNLILVLFTELLLAFVFGARSPVKLLITALANIATNPFVVICALLFNIILREKSYVVIFALETAAVITEGLIFSKAEVFDGKNPYLLSFILNLVSFLIGEIINLL